jgi:hypothetical protein
MVIRALPLALLFALAGCGGSSNATGSCDSRQVNHACLEYDGAPDVLSPYKSTCTQAQGTWSDSPCTRTGAVGGCMVKDTSLGLTYTTWFFAPVTTDSVKQSCMSSNNGNATFVSP